VPIGKEVAFHSKAHNRYIRMNSGTYADSSDPKSATDLPRSWGWEKFLVVDAGKGDIALHCASHNRFLRMTNKKNIDRSGTKDKTKLPSGWTWERFKAVNAGNGEIALHNKVHNRFVRMTNRNIKGSRGKHKDMDASGKKAANALPGNWGWERFKIVVAAWDAPVGKLVAFHSKVHNRYIRMNKGNNCDTSDPKGVNDLPKNWGWEKFSVVDAGSGEIALHSSSHDRFLRMNRKNIDRSGKKGASKLPKGWTWERFKVVNAGGGEIALHNKVHNRFVRMKNSPRGRKHKDMDSSGEKSASNLPAGWTWERFTVVLA